MSINLDKTLRDTGRREINLREYRIEEILPDYIVQNYPKFVSLLKNYFDFENEPDSPSRLIDDLFNTRDISQTDFTLLNYIEDELLLGQSYFQGFPDKRSAAKFSNTLYRSKGTKFSIQQFFRMFFNIDPDIVYTKEQIFNVSGNRDYATVEKEALRDLGVDSYYQLDRYPDFMVDEAYRFDYTFGTTVTLTVPHDKNFFYYQDIVRSQYEWKLERIVAEDADGNLTLEEVPISVATITPIIQDTPTPYRYGVSQVNVTLNSPTSEYILTAKINNGFQRFEEYIALNYVPDSMIGPNSQRFLTDDKLYQDFAILIKSGLPLATWKEVYKLFAHPAGIYLGSEVQLVSAFDLDIDNQPDPGVFDIPPFIIEGEASLTPRGFAQHTALFNMIEGAGQLQYRTTLGTPGTYPTSGNELKDYEDFTLDQVHQQYSSIGELLSPNSPTLDEGDSGYNGERFGLDIGSTETIDQDQFTWVEPYYRDSGGTLVVRDDSDSEITLYELDSTNWPDSV